MLTTISITVQCRDNHDTWVVPFTNEAALFQFIKTAGRFGIDWVAYDTSEFGGFTPLDYHREGNRTYFTDPFDRVVFEGNALEKGA